MRGERYPRHLMTTVVVSKNVLLESKNSSILKYLKKTGVTLKKKFLVTLSIFDLKDFGIDPNKIESQNLNLKLTKLPIEESQIPRHTLTENQKNRLELFGLKPELSQNRLISEILPSQVDMSKFTDNEMDEILSTLDQLKNKYEKRDEHQKAMTLEIEQEQNQIEADNKAISEKYRDIEAKLKKLQVKEKQLEVTEKNLEDLASKVIENETNQTATQKAQEEFYNKIQQNMDDLEEKQKIFNEKVSEHKAREFQLKELLKRHKVNQSEYNDLFSVSSKDEFYAGGNNDNNFLEELNQDRNVQNPKNGIFSELPTKAFINSTMNSDQVKQSVAQETPNGDFENGYLNL